MNAFEKHMAALPAGTLNRRDWHRLALVAAMTPWLGACAQAQAVSSSAEAAQGPRWQVDPFSLGVASGQPQSDSVVLWTRLRITEADAAQMAQSVGVVCELFADAALRQPVRQWRVQTDAGRAHSVHVIATGLQAGRHYWYRFVCGSATSPVGHTRTSPGVNDAVDRLRIALASCQHFEQTRSTCCASTKAVCPSSWTNTANAMRSTRAMRTCAPAMRRTPG
jgi:alkaline phosphatase D